MNEEMEMLELNRESASYPKGIRRFFGELATPPIFYLGNLSILELPSVGFCGSRRASETGLSITYDAAFQLAKEGVCVVSGYAAGVDMAAHRAALDAGGVTIVVLAEGMDHFRIKREIRDLWDWDRVLVISQFAPRWVWRADRAMERNEVIVALADVVIVIEAGETGGTLHAGFAALKQQKPLFVTNYSEPTEASLGNRTLLESGGLTLNRNKQSGLPDLTRLFRALQA